MMNNLKFGVLAVASCLGLSTATQAQAIPKAEYETAKGAIKSNHEVNKKACDALANNAKSVCVEQCEGDEKIAKADLEERYEPTAKHHFKSRVARADAEYDVAKARCNDKAGTDKDVCVEEAKASKVHAVANAKTQMKTWKANSAANETKADANTKAKEEVAVARKDAATEKRDADYAVAKTKCETFAGATKDACVDKAKADYGQK